MSIVVKELVTGVATTRKNIALVPWCSYSLFNCIKLEFGVTGHLFGPSNACAIQRLTLVNFSDHPF